MVVRKILGIPKAFFIPTILMGIPLDEISQKQLTVNVPNIFRLAKNISLEVNLSKEDGELNFLKVPEKLGKDLNNENKLQDLLRKLSNDIRNLTVNLESINIGEETYTTKEVENIWEKFRELTGFTDLEELLEEDLNKRTEPSYSLLLTIFPEKISLWLEFREIKDLTHTVIIFSTDHPDWLRGILEKNY